VEAELSLKKWITEMGADQNFMENLLPGYRLVKSTKANTPELMTQGCK